MQVNAAVIGCGSWGRNHARVYDELPAVNLKAVADLNPQTAENIGRKHGVKWYTDIDKILSDPDIELVSICTPTITHAEIGLKAIEAGKHLLVEKPMTNTIQEAETLIRNAENKGVKLTVGFVERFNPAVQEAFRLIESGKIGDVILAHTRRVSRNPQRIGDVGVIKDLAIHDIDITSALFRDPPQTVHATAGSIAHHYEDYANINVGYTRNRTAFIETNWLTPRRVRTLTITGTEGIINVEYTTQQINIENTQQMTQPFLPYREPLYLELQHFVDSVIKDTQPQITGHDGLKALQICEAALESSRTGQTVKLELLT
jgi:UDP-N-acetylglucosamine 3-dehydrogenase